MEEVGSEDVERAVAGSDRIATSAAAYPEARAAFARLEREGEISPEQNNAAITDLDADWPSFGVADLTRTFARFCGRTAARFGLRGYDAVHLASAVSVELAAQLKHEEDVRRGVEGSRIEAVHFYTYDERLKRAARRVLHVYEPGDGGESTSGAGKPVPVGARVALRGDGREPLPDARGPVPAKCYPPSAPLLCLRSRSFSTRDLSTIQCGATWPQTKNIHLNLFTSFPDYPILILQL